MSQNARPQPGPLQGIRVVEFTHMVMGPIVGYVLACLGAEVIRVEPMGGDPTRFLLGSGAGYFPVHNRGKRSLCVDLKRAEGVEIARQLIASADILIENFRPGALDRLGLGYEALQASNPRLIYASEKGFLPGPYDQRTALDEVVQMMSGLAYMTGPPGRPLRAGAAVVDISGGLFGVIGILAALLARQSADREAGLEKGQNTGRGQKIDVGLFETSAFLVSQHMAQLGVTGSAAQPMPARIAAWSIYEIFQTRDDPIFLGIVTDSLWRTFCEIFELSDFAADPRLAQNQDRVDARNRILPRIEALFRPMRRAEIIARLEGTGVPFAPINRPEDMVDDPHLLASGSLQSVRVGAGREAILPLLPMVLDGVRVRTSPDLPAPGADKRAILLELGMSPDEIAQLVANGTIG